MATVRVAPGSGERLVRVLLLEVDERTRLLASRRLREKRWEQELRPDVGYSPTMRQRLAALNDAVELERAALWPKQIHRLPESAVRKVLGDG